VITSRTGAAAAYVGLSRGREANTAHVITITGVEDTAQGGGQLTLHRDPIAVLAAILDEPDHSTARSALVVASESVDEARTVRAAAELLADAAQLAATERTPTCLDQLTNAGVLTRAQRTQLAAEDGAANLTRILRRAELAGHDPRQVLVDAVADRPLDGVRNASNVIYSRIRHAHRFDPCGESWQAWVPTVDNADWRDYLGVLAAAADRRAAVLGAQVAAEQQAWAVEAFRSTIR